MWPQRSELDMNNYVILGEEEMVGYFSLHIFSSRDSYMSLWDAEGPFRKSLGGIQMLCELYEQNAGLVVEYGKYYIGTIVPKLLAQNGSSYTGPPLFLQKIVSIEGTVIAY